MRMWMFLMSLLGGGITYDQSLKIILRQTLLIEVWNALRKGYWILIFISFINGIKKSMNWFDYLNMKFIFIFNLELHLL